MKSRKITLPRRLAQSKFTVVYFKDDDWFVGYVEEIRGCWSQGKTEKSLINNVKDAIKLMLLVNREEVYNTLKSQKITKKQYNRKTLKV